MMSILKIQARDSVQLQGTSKAHQSMAQLLVQQLLHALLRYLINPSSAKKVPSVPGMRLQLLPSVAPFSLCTCRMPWHRAGREVEEGQGSLKALFGR